MSERELEGYRAHPFRHHREVSRRRPTPIVRRRWLQSIGGCGAVGIRLPTEHCL